MSDGGAVEGIIAEHLRDRQGIIAKDAAEVHRQVRIAALNASAQMYSSLTREERGYRFDLDVDVLVTARYFECWILTGES